MVDANALVEGITFRICRFIEASLPLRVTRMAAEFVLDDYGQAWFTHTSELYTVPKEKRWQAASGNMKSQVCAIRLSDTLPRPAVCVRFGLHHGELIVHSGSTHTA